MKKTFLTIVTAMVASLTSFGQVASYSFNKGNANDEIGSNNGMVNGATLTTDRFGNSDHAYLFDGIDDNINFGDDSAFQMGTGSFSISLWIKTDSIVPKGDILGKKSISASANYNQYSLSYNNSNGLIQGSLRGEVSSFANHNLGTNNIDTTGWNHIVMIYDEMCNCSQLYLNNQLVDSDTLDLTTSTFDVISFPLVIGWRNAQQDFAFKGKIDDLSIYKLNLSAQQVDSLYNAPNPRVVGQVAGYSFNNGNANDEIGSNNGIVNGATLTTDRFGNSDHAYLFDGIDDNINFGDDGAFQMGTGSFSISLWIKTDSIVPKGDILGKKSISASANYNQYSLSYNNSNGLIQGSLRGEISSFANHNLGTNNIDTTGWNHIVMIYDEMCNCSQLYLNNQLVDSDTLDLATSTFNVMSFPLVIGWRNAQQDFAFKGKIDDLSIYKLNLSAQQVDSLYNAPNPAGLSVNDLKNQPKFMVYPNPTNGTIQIKAEKVTYSQVSITDVRGRVMITTSNKQVIDLSALEQGIYLIRLLDESGRTIATQKIIKV